MNKHKTKHVPSCNKQATQLAKLPRSWCFRCGLDRKRWRRNARRR